MFQKEKGAKEDLFYVDVLQRPNIKIHMVKFSNQVTKEAMLKVDSTKVVVIKSQVYKVLAKPQRTQKYTLIGLHD